MVKGIFFDLDGTIINSDQSWFESLNFTRREFNLPEISLNDYTTLSSGVSVREFLEKTGVKTEIGSKISKRWSVNYEKLKKEVRPVSGMMELIKKLREEGYKIGLVTSRRKENLIPAIAEMGLDSLFDVVVGKEKTLKDKPAPDMLLVASDKLQLKPGNCMYIGDRDSDIIAAKSCGMKSISVTWGVHDKEMLERIDSENIVDDATRLYEMIKVLSE